MGQAGQITSHLLILSFLPLLGRVGELALCKLEIKRLDYMFHGGSDTRAELTFWGI